MISVPDPCTQQWMEMMPVDKGRFCTHCSKTVNDFTQMFDADVLKHIQENGLGCGRFYAHQLERKMIVPVPRRWYRYSRWIAGLVFVIGWGKDGQAQRKLSVPVEQFPPVNNQASDSAQIKPLLIDKTTALVLIDYGNVEIMGSVAGNNHDIEKMIKALVSGNKHEKRKRFFRRLRFWK